MESPGGAKKRPGFKFVKECKGPISILTPFKRGVMAIGDDFVEYVDVKKAQEKLEEND